MLERQSIAFAQTLPQRLTIFTNHRVIVPLLMLILAAIYFLRFNHAVGIGGDDAWYVLLAKSLANGQGFQLINSPVTGILPSYPPAFPFLLSLLLRCLRTENLWLLKLVSSAAMLGVGMGTFAYAARVRKLPLPLAATMMLAVVLMPAFVFLATSTVMSECVFTLAQLLTVIAAEKVLCRQCQSAAWLGWVGVAMLASWAFLTRSIAVGLVLAVGLYLLKERNYKAVVIFTGSTLLFIAPWMLYTRVNATSAELKRAHGGNIVYTYGDQLWMKRAGASNSGTETVWDLPTRIWQNAYNIAARDFCGMLFPSLLRSPQESGEETFALGESETLGGGSMKGVVATAVVSVGLSCLALLGFVVVASRRITLAEILLPCSFAIIVIWPWWTFRFVLPLAPFLLHYILVGLATLTQGAHRLLRRAKANDEWAVPRLFMLCVLALYGYDHLGYIRSQLQNTEASAWMSEYKESSETLEWVRTHLPPDAVVAASNPARVFLHSGHKAISCEQPLENWEIWKRIGVRYVVILESHGRTVLDGQERAYPVLYRSPNDMRVVDLGPPTTRTTLQR